MKNDISIELEGVKRVMDQVLAELKSILKDLDDALAKSAVDPLDPA